MGPSRSIGYSSSRAVRAALSFFASFSSLSCFSTADSTSSPAVENLRALCVHTLEPLRVALGLPIVITSGYRGKELNHLLVNHSVTSQHMNGQAADFYVAEPKVSDPAADLAKPSRRELLIRAFRQIITDDAIAFDQLIIYPSFIHVSYVRSGRKNRSKLTKAFANGSYAALTRNQALALE